MRSRDDVQSRTMDGQSQGCHAEIPTALPDQQPVSHRRRERIRATRCLSDHRFARDGAPSRWRKSFIKPTGRVCRTPAATVVISRAPELEAELCLSTAMLLCTALARGEMFYMRLTHCSWPPNTVRNEAMMMAQARSSKSIASTLTVIGAKGLFVALRTNSSIAFSGGKGSNGDPDNNVRSTPYALIDCERPRHNIKPMSRAPTAFYTDPGSRVTRAPFGARRVLVREGGSLVHPPASCVLPSRCLPLNSTSDLSVRHQPEGNQVLRPSEVNCVSIFGVSVVAQALLRVTCSGGRVHGIAP